MTMYGADPDQLEQLGATLRQQMATVEGVVAHVGRVLAGTDWQGPARQRFEEDWHGSFTQALGRLVQAFEAAGADCAGRAADLRRVMGA
jgi:uncharacterized protein YukE